MSHFPTIFKTRQATIEALSASGTPLTLKAFASQTANLFTVTNSSDTVMGGFTAKGQLLAHGPTNSVTNVAVGSSALNVNSTATNNVAVGYLTLSSLTGGSGKNIAIGNNALNSCTTGAASIAIGPNALEDQTTAGSNIAIGNLSLANMNGGSSNIAIGLSAMTTRTSNSGSIAIGQVAMSVGDAGNSVAIGGSSLQDSTGATARDVAVGIESGSTKEGGTRNVFLGYRAGRNNSNINGDYSSNIFVGANTGNSITTGATGNILIGTSVDLPTAGGSNQLSIGNIIFGTGINATTGLIGIHQNSPTAFMDLPASTTASASIRLRTGSAPTSPNDGDMWQDGTDLKVRINGVTKTVTTT